MKMSKKIKRDFLEYESIGNELKALSVLVEALGTRTVTELSDSDVKETCFALVSDMIYDRAVLTDELFEDYFEIGKAQNVVK